MAIVFDCPHCNHHLRVPENVAGKRIKCPQCREVLRVPEASETKSEDEIALPERDEERAVELLQLKTPDGNVYGPVPRSEMDRWLVEGRITAQCELLDREGQHWRWASEVYPRLAEAATPPPPPPPGVPAPQAAVTVAPQIPTVAASVTVSPIAEVPIAEEPAAGTGPGRSMGWSDVAPLPFRTRGYPAMILTSKFYRALGWLLIFAAGVAAFFYAVIVVGGTIANEQMGGGQLAVFLGLSLLGLVGGAICIAAIVVTLWFASEAIKCLLDIEDNSHRCSFYLQNLTRKENVE